MMAKASAKSSLAGKLGASLNKAVATHASDETQYDSGGRLPADLENAVAQLTKCYFAQYEKGPNKGEYYFYASGVIVSPDECIVDASNRVASKGSTMKLAGKQTSIMEPMCETKGRSRESLDDHTDWVMNEMRKLGADTSEVTTGDDLEELAAALVEEAPYFKVRTWRGEPTKQFPNPRTNEVWQGACDFDPETGEASGVEDNTEEAEEEATEEESGAETEGEELDLEALGTAADEGDEEAQATISEQCAAAELDPDDYPTWAEAATALMEATSGEEGSEEEPAEEEATPEVDEVWEYFPIDPKTKKKGKKKVSVEVKSVNKAKKTATVLNLDDNKTKYANVPFAQLLSE